MTRAEGAGLGVSAVAHLAILAALSVGWMMAPKPIVPPQTPVDVRLVDEVGLEAAVPEPATEQPAPSIAPEVGPPEETVEPTPAPPLPKAVTPPAPKATPPPPKPAPVSRPQPQPKAATAAPARPAPTKAAPPQIAQRGSRLGPDFLKGISDRPSASTSQTPRAAKVGAREMAGLVDAIRRQVQPCADRITSPGPGANQIGTRLNLRLNPDGSFAAKPAVIGQTGVTDENNRYARRVGELAAAAFVQCAPFELPADLYDGWKNFNLNYRLPA